MRALIVEWVRCGIPLLEACDSCIHFNSSAHTVSPCDAPEASCGELELQVCGLHDLEDWNSLLNRNRNDIEHPD